MISGYRLIRKEGRGSTSEVWAAENCADGRKVALKIYTKLKHLDEIALSLFHDEFKITKSFTHPNILSALDFFTEEGIPVIVYQLCESCLEKELTARKLTNLNNKVKTSRLFSDPELSKIVDQVASGLEYIHSCGIVHNDIKPSNVVFLTDASGNRHYYLTDFGISYDVKQVVNNEMKSKIASSKTLLYAAPEKFRNERSTQKSDIFSFGVLLYELAGGKDNPILPGMIIEQGGQLLTNNVSKKFHKIIYQCTQQDPEKRPSSAELKSIFQKKNQNKIVQLIYRLLKL